MSDRKPSTLTEAVELCEVDLQPLKLYPGMPAMQGVMYGNSYTPWVREPDPVFVEVRELDQGTILELGVPVPPQPPTLLKASGQTPLLHACGARYTGAECTAVHMEAGRLSCVECSRCGFVARHQAEDGAVTIAENGGGSRHGPTEEDLAWLRKVSFGAPEPNPEGFRVPDSLRDQVADQGMPVVHCADCGGSGQCPGPAEGEVPTLEVADLELLATAAEGLVTVHSELARLPGAQGRVAEQRREKISAAVERVRAALRGEQ